MRRAWYVTLGFNPGPATEAVVEARQAGGSSIVYLVMGSVGGVVDERAEEAAESVEKLGERVGVRVERVVIDPSDPTEVITLYAHMAGNDEVRVYVGGGMRAVTIYALLAALMNKKRLAELRIKELARGISEEVPAWVIDFTTSSEAPGKLRVLMALHDNPPKTPEEVARETGYSVITVSKYLKALKRLGLAKKSGRRRYALTEEGLVIKRKLGRVGD